MPNPGFESHDHARCIAVNLDTVDAACERKGLQLTPARRRVVEILLQEHRAMGAYEVLDSLRKDGFGSQPPVAYRALDFLVRHGFVHRIERLNAFVACADPGQEHAPTFLICRACGTVAEVMSRGTAAAVQAAAGDVGFVPECIVVEAEGLCPSCAETPSA